MSSLDLVLAKMQDRLNGLKVAYERKANNWERIPGRRIPFVLLGYQVFNNAFTNGRFFADVHLEVTPRGPFVMTYYPMLLTRVDNGSASSALNGIWQPVFTWPLPEQEPIASTGNPTVVDLSWEFQDGRAMREFQSGGSRPRGSAFTNASVNNVQSVPSLVSSAPGGCAPLVKHVFFNEKSIIIFRLKYEAVNFVNGTEYTPRQGTIVIALPGYRILR